MPNADDAAAYQEFAAAPPADAWVRRIWFLRSAEAGPAVPIVPDGCPEIILHLGQPFARLGADGRWRRQARGLAAGQLTGPLHLAPAAEADVVGVRFHPVGARAVLGLPLDLLRDDVVPLREIARGVEDALLDAAASAGTAAERAAAIGRAVCRLARRTPDPVAVAATRALGSPAAPALAGLARTLGVSPRTFERRLRDEAGLAPRDLRGVLRFRRAFRLLQHAPPGRWGRVAPAAGYFDQAHLVRDFRRFAGASPSAFFGAEPALSVAILGDG